MNHCTNCNRETKNPKFCSMSCAAKYNNAKNPKKQPSNKCRTCESPIRQKWVWCKDCKTKNNTKDETLRELQYTHSYKTNGWTKVRTRARAVAKRLGWTSCEKCGYNKHVEICHIKAIKDFSLDEKISIVNAENNLRPLCPNCHWELDNLIKGSSQIS